MAGGRAMTVVQVADHVAAAPPSLDPPADDATCDRGFRSSRSFRYPLLRLECMQKRNSKTADRRLITDRFSAPPERWTTPIITQVPVECQDNNYGAAEEPHLRSSDFWRSVRRYGWIAMPRPIPFLACLSRRAVNAVSAFHPGRRHLSVGMDRELKSAAYAGTSDGPGVVRRRLRRDMAISRTTAMARTRTAIGQ
jgi:hypothetical protein